MITCLVPIFIATASFIFSTRYKTENGQKLDPIEELIIEVKIAYSYVAFPPVVAPGFSPSSLSYKAFVTSRCCHDRFY